MRFESSSVGGSGGGKTIESTMLWNLQQRDKLMTATSRHTSSDRSIGTAHGTTIVMATKRHKRRGTSMIKSAGCYYTDQLFKML
jgi:hypothetical protein